MISPLYKLTATHALELISNNTISVEAYARSLLARIEERDSTVKAWAYLDPALVLSQARALDKLPIEKRGPLHCLPIDMPTQYGSPIYQGHQPTFDSSAVAILRAAGALIFGKSTTTEFTVMNSGPETTNPHDPNRTPMSVNQSEVSLRDLTQGLAKTKPKDYRKPWFYGERADHDGLNHFWIYNCCIDQNSSAVLEEAIISMYAWHRNVDRCYVYLWDVIVDASSLEGTTYQPPPIHLWESAFRRSRWFTRGWILQELLAPQPVKFFTKEGIRLGDKSSLESIIHQVTSIPVAALRGTSLASFSVVERLRWTENRQTKRKEDKAYCLLGIFGVSMNHRYGEGDKAFERLRRKIENKNDLLSTLPMAKDAAFNSLHNQHEPICLEDSRCIFWLNVIAGTGKSTIARTIARVHYDLGALGGSYFFSKGGGDLSKANRLVTILAGQLAAGMSKPRRHISEAIATREDIVELSLRDQWKHLIIGHLSMIPNHSTERTRVVLSHYKR